MGNIINFALIIGNLHYRITNESDETVFNALLVALRYLSCSPEMGLKFSIRVKYRGIQNRSKSN